MLLLLLDEAIFFSELQNERYLLYNGWKQPLAKFGPGYRWRVVFWKRPGPPTTYRCVRSTGI